MFFLQKRKIFIVKANFRNSTKVGRIWKYSVIACVEEFRKQFLAVAFNIKNLDKLSITV